MAFENLLILTDDKTANTTRLGLGPSGKRIYQFATEKRRKKSIVFENETQQFWWLFPVFWFASCVNLFVPTLNQDVGWFDLSWMKLLESETSGRCNLAVVQKFVWKSHVYRPLKRPVKCLLPCWRSSGENRALFMNTEEDAATTALFVLCLSDEVSVRVEVRLSGDQYLSIREVHSIRGLSHYLPLRLC